MIRAVIIDDEKAARGVLFNYLRQYCSDVEVVANASTVQTGYNAIKKHRPDVVFLDVELGDGKGFDLLDKFHQINFKIIFVTGYSEFATRAFRCCAVDYLLKPVQINELKEACAKVRDINTSSVTAEQMSLFFKNVNGNYNSTATLVIPHLKGFHVLKISDIILCKADGYCTNFILTGKRKIVSSKNLKQYEDLLNSHNFIRVHHSYIVNIKHICSYSKEGEIFLTEKNIAYLGYAYKNGFMKLFIKR